MDTETRQIHNFLAGDLFDRHYRLLEHVGSGGFADVWKAKDELVDTIVALKIYTRLDKEGISELAKEYKEMRGIKHPNLLTGNHFDASGNIPYLEMDYCDGGSLYGKMGKMSNDELLHVLRDIAGGLAYLHREGIVHQDIKPENILYDTKKDRYLLSDFGISGKSRTRLSHSVNKANMTLSMTEAYAPPEKFSGNLADIEPDTKGDIFSLGMTMFELAVGRLPFTPPMATGREMLFSEKRGVPLRLDYSQIKDSQLRKIVEGCTKYAPKDRPASDEILAMISAKVTEPGQKKKTNGGRPPTVEINVNGGGQKGTGIGQSGTNPPPPPPPPPPRPTPDRKWIYIAVVVAAAMLGVLLVFLLKPKPTSPPELEDTMTCVTPSQSSVPQAEENVERNNNPISEVTTGTLAITSTPSGASVKVDGRYMGVTPLTLEELAPGRYEITFSADDYETVTQTARVRAGKTAGCRSDLKKKQTEEQQPKQTELQPRKSTAGVYMDGNTIVCTVDGTEYCYKMVYVSGGTYTMGCTSEQRGDCSDDEKPAHSVTVSGFYIGQTEVTQALWKAVMGSNPSYWKGNTLPVESVSYNDVKEFIGKLNSLTGKTFRLPTEAEWEFAARGGNSSRGYKYSGSDNLGSVAWYGDNSGSKTHPVAQKQANELGLYDMSGNVWESCNDWYDSYSSGPQSNPKGPSSGSSRVARGGGWYYYARYCRVSYRSYGDPSNRNIYLGFRLALSAR